MNDTTQTHATEQPAVGAPVDRSVGRPVLYRAGPPKPPRKPTNTKPPQGNKTPNAAVTGTPRRGST